MANYIDKEIICESYVHINVPADLDEASTTKIKNHIKRFFDERVEFFFGDDVDTAVTTEDGSLIVKLTAWGSIAALLGTGVIKYPEFRDGLRAMHDDAQVLAQATNLETVFLTRTPSCNRLHSEARTGVIGRASNLITRIETMKAHAASIKVPTGPAGVRQIEQLALSIQTWDTNARRMLEKVRSDEDRFCLAKGLYEGLKQLPKTLPAETELKSSSLKSTVLKSQNLDLTALSAFQRYSAAIRTADEVLRSIALASLPSKS